MATAEADSLTDSSRKEAEATKLPPPSGRVPSLGREKNTAQLRGWCQICGDAAYNRNFGALSCDSCKAFFRRNVNRTPFGRCEGKCEITIESRTFCKKCRFNKCLAVGMKRHLVKGRGMKEKEEISCDSTGGGEVESTSRRNSETEESLLLEAEIASTLSDEEVTSLMEPELRPAFSEMMNAWKKTYGAYLYNDTEKPQMVEIMNLIEGPLKTLVSFAKNLPRFKCLPVQDQISLLKGCAAEAAIIRSSLSYNSMSNGWNVSAPGGKRVNVSADILKSDAKDVFQSVVKFYKGVQKIIKGDDVFVYFMITLGLFASDREKLNKPEVVQDTQQLYASVLQSYCRIRHPAEKNLTARILMKIVDIRDVGNCALKLFQSADNDQLRPLLHEIFDLPPPEKMDSKPSPSTSTSGDLEKDVKVKSEPEEAAASSSSSSQGQTVNGLRLAASSSATLSQPQHTDNLKIDIKRSTSVESYSSSCPSTPRTPNTPQRMPPLEYNPPPRVSLGPKLGRPGAQGHPGVVSGSNVTSSVSSLPDDGCHPSYHDTYPDSYPDSLDSRRVSADSFDWHAVSSSASVVSGGAYVSINARNQHVTSLSSSRGSSPRGLNSNSNSQSSSFSPPDGDLISSHSQQLHLDSRVANHAPSDHYHSANQCNLSSSGHFAPNTHPARYSRSHSVDQTLSHETSVNFKPSGHVGQHSPDFNQPPVKTSRSANSSSLQTFSEMSPPAGTSGMPIYGDPHQVLPSHPPKNRIPHNSNDPTYSDVPFDFRVHKRGNIS